MVIVPEETPLEIDAFILNKDIGFVATGQEAFVTCTIFVGKTTANNFRLRNFPGVKNT